MMQKAFRELMAASPVTGLAVAVMEQGVITVDCAGEFGGETISEATVWPVASLTKPVFVYGVLQLVQKGLLELDRPLQEYLPSLFLDVGGDVPLITARQAMSHSTGLPNWRDAQGLRTTFQPGSKFSYSSEGLNALQTVVEHLTGTSMQDYLHQHVFVPFGMANTELRRETEETVPPFASFFLKTLPANGALSLRTTIEDYGRFMQAMLELSEIAREMLSPRIDVGEYAALKWGLGWGLQGTGDALSFWHWGARSIPQTMNFAVGWPQQQKALVIFTNHAEGLWLCRDMIKSAFPDETVAAFDWLLPAKNWRPDGSRVE